MKTIIAAYDSKCPGCGEPIAEGDEIALDEDDEIWVCEDCAEEF